MIFMFKRNPLKNWRNKNSFYYKDIEKFFQFWVQPESSVLEIGNGTSNLLHTLKPEHAISIEIRTKTQSSKFQYASNILMMSNIEEFPVNQEFDYVLLPNTISHVTNIQSLLINCHSVSNPSTRLIITFHNPAWEIILQLASFLGQRMYLPDLNWLSLEDVRNLLDLSNFEVITSGKRCLIPRNILFLSPIVNRFIAPLPIFNKMCLTEYIIARPRQNFHQPQSEILSNFSCSVIIPARNEANNIENCVTRMPQLGRFTEIIFVEGNSQDETWSTIKKVQTQYGKEYGNSLKIKAIQQTGRGKGNAVREASQLAEGDILIILDSDLTVQPEDLIYFFSAVALNYCEFANGCRLVYPLYKETMPWINRIANRFFAWLLSFLLNIKIKDSLCGTKALKKTDYEKIYNTYEYFTNFDPFGDFDLLFGAAKLGLKIQDIPVRYVSRTYGRSNISHFKEGFILLKMCLYAAIKIKFV